MEKTIMLSGKKVRLRSTAATPLIYKNQFKRDYLADLLKIATVMDVKEPSMKSKSKKADKLALDKLTLDQVDNLDLTVLWQYLWALAKNADMEIPEPVEWLSRFESLDIETLIPEIQELLITSIQSQKKSTAPISLTNHSM